MTKKPRIFFLSASYVLAILAFVFNLIHLGLAAQGEYVRFSKPDLLTFDELVEWEKNDPPSAALADKLRHLLTTPILSNESYFGGAKPKRPSSPELGPFLRAICWNIERGIQFDPIRIALSEPEKFVVDLVENEEISGLEDVELLLDDFQLLGRQRLGFGILFFSKDPTLDPKQIVLL